jgi:hypothetical protein
MAKRILFVFSTCFIPALLIGRVTSGANYLPLVEKQSNQVTVSIKTLEENATFFLYYKTEGMKNFQVRKMQADSAGVVRHRISTENLYGKNIEYYIVEEKENGTKALSPTHTITSFTNKESPDIYFQDNSTPSAPGAPRVPILNVNGSLSTSTKISDNSEYPGQNYTANGNLRIYKNISKNNFQFDFDTNFTHIDPRDRQTESLINLSSMMIRIKNGETQLEVGDISVNETEYTTSYLNRRGLRFELSGKTLYLNAFYTNSQQKKGFDGYGIPAASAGIFGAVAGFNLKNTIKIRGMFMTGKDNLDSKTIVSTENPFREGETFSIWGEMNMLKNSLQVTGEASSSNFGSAPGKEEINKVSDAAWKAGIKYNKGILSFASDYENIGDRFNSIANMFLQNDREGLISNLGINIKTFSWNVTYLDKKNYAHSRLQDMLHEKRVGTTVNWGIGSHFRIGADISRDNLDYDSKTGLQTASSDMNTYNYSASLGYMAGSNGININLGKIESVNFTSNLNASLALNLRFGQFISLSPTLSYQENKNLFDNSKATVYNFYLNSEITFSPQYFSLTISTSYMNNESASNTSSTWSVGGNLNFYMAEIFKNKLRPALSIKSLFQGSKYGNIESDSAIFSLQADIAF